MIIKTIPKTLQTNIIITRINIFLMIFVVINQTNQHKAKIYDHYTCTQIIIKKFHNYSKKNHNYIKNVFHFTNMKKKLFAKYKNDKFIIE